MHYAAAMAVHERIEKGWHFSVTSNSSTSVVHQCGNGGTGIKWCAEILFIQTCKLRTNQLLTKCAAPGCRHITKTLCSSCLQEAYLNPFLSHVHPLQRTNFPIHGLRRVCIDPAQIHPHLPTTEYYWVRRRWKCISASSVLELNLLFSHLLPKAVFAIWETTQTKLLAELFLHLH